MSRRTFTVTAERGRDPWWVTECAEVGAVSQVRRLDQAADDIREAIAYLSGLPEDSFDIEVAPVLPDAFWEAMRGAEDQRAAAAAANRAAAELNQRAARVLRDEGLTLRDVGHLMGVSHQRAAQLAG